jgi:subtilisin family serine protease
MGRRRTVTPGLGVVAAMVLGVFGPVLPAGAAPPGPAAAPPGPAAAPARATQVVTLVTGDRVLLRPGGRVDVRPGPGREDMTFVARRDRGHLLVLPADGAAAVRQDRADRRLFDVTTLLDSGYGDARGGLPVIVTGSAGAGTARAAGATGVRSLAGGRITAFPADRSGRLWRSLSTARSAGTKLWLDGRVRATLDHSVPQIGAPAAWAAGHTGAGATVAVLDTGIDAGHPDLAGAVVGSADFTGNPAGVEDGNGHGTHVASTVTGENDTYRGVAPDARLLVGKVLDDSGAGVESQIIAGMEWAATSGADVVNMSLGSSVETDGTDLMSRELNRISRESGTLFVVAAGNSGPSEGSIGSPGAADEALTVGAVDAQDGIADFSSRGPRTGDGAVKPDLTAPGVDIVAARSAGSALGEPVGEDHQRLSGTSMATPHVAGAAAILAGQHPDWTPQQLKAALVASARPGAGIPVDAQGAGRVDVARAVAQTAWATPVSISGGVVEWPHDDDIPVSRTVTYTNAGAAALVLDLATDAPAGVVSLSAASVTVPAGGTAAVTVRFDTTGDRPDGRYAGLLTATGRDGRTVVRTVVAVQREVESYDVTVTVLDATGTPTPAYDLWFVDLDRGTSRIPYDEDGTVTTRLPKGRYFLEAWLSSPDVSSFALEPGIVVAADTALRIDARDARSPVLRTQRPAAVGEGTLSYELHTDSGGVLGWIVGPDFEGLRVLPSRTSGRPGEFAFGVEGVLARPDGAGGFHGSPYQYHLAFSAADRVPADLDRSFADRTLGTVRGTVAGSGLTAVKDKVASFAVPGALTELFSPDHDWFGDVDVHDGPSPDSVQVGWWYDDAPRRYAAGSRTVERWGRAVLGPHLPQATVFLPPATRGGDSIFVALPLHGDTAGHSGYGDVLGTTTLFRDGVALTTHPYAASGDWSVPPGDAAYRLETTATGTGIGGQSPTIAVRWAFRSAHTEQEAALPLLAVRFAPPVDARNTARAGRPFAVPVRVTTLPGTAYGRLRPPVVEVSYDEGGTWRRAPVVAGTALLRHPAGARWVSLRATASDTAGNSVRQTILRAYALR